MRLLLMICILSLSTAGFANTRKVQAMIRAEAQRQGVDPIIALSVARVESNFNAKAVGPVGEVGVFQIRPKSPRDYSRLLNVRINIHEGIKQLKWWATNCPIKDKGLFFICFNNGYRSPKHPTLHPYYKRVISAMESFSD